MMPIILLLLVLTSKVNSESNDESTIWDVSSPAGTFRGVVRESIQNYRYVAFLGIPYAQPPVNKLRFAKPIRYPKLDHLFEATTFAPPCVQPAGTNTSNQGQEDCLYLNIYLPLQQKEGSNETEKLKKVAVFIHGVGFVLGSADQFIPGDLVALGDIIVVTFNYRLSWLGSLKGPTPQLSGNQGIWDQLLALNWVKENIRSFGGDPDDITLAGHSGGATCVALLSIVPQAKGLFTKGIMASSSMFNNAATFGSSNVLLELLAEKVGCKELNPNKTVECLRGLPTESFILPHDPSVAKKFTTIDEDLLAAPIRDLIKDRKYLTNVGFYSRNYLVSVTNNEGAIFFSAVLSHRTDPQNIDAQFVKQWTNLSLETCEKILEWYKEPTRFNFNKAFDIIGDFEIYLPTFEFLDTFVSASRGSNDTEASKLYLMLFDHLPLYLPSPMFGTIHGVDLNYLFDLQPSDVLKMYYGLEADAPYLADDWMVKRRFMAVMADYIKTGNPGALIAQDFSLKWSAYNQYLETYLRFNNYASIEKHLYKERRKFLKKAISQHAEQVLHYSYKDEL